MPEFHFSSDPQEFAEALERSISLAQMDGEATRHEVMRLFEELGLEQLANVRRVLTAIACSENPGEQAHYWMGFLTALLHGRGVCAACGIDHSKVPTDD